MNSKLQEMYIKCKEMVQPIVLELPCLSSPQNLKLTISSTPHNHYQIRPDSSFFCLPIQPAVAKFPLSLFLLSEKAKDCNFTIPPWQERCPFMAAAGSCSLLCNLQSCLLLLPSSAVSRLHVYQSQSYRSASWGEATAAESCFDREHNAKGHKNS